MKSKTVDQLLSKYMYNFLWKKLLEVNFFRCTFPKDSFLTDFTLLKKYSNTFLRPCLVMFSSLYFVEEIGGRKWKRPLFPLYLFLFFLFWQIVHLLFYVTEAVSCKLPIFLLRSPHHLGEDFFVDVFLRYLTF